jgi:hypothetical protein
MNREELAALHDALEVVLAWPDSVRAEVARWLAAPAASKPNGRDPHPPPLASVRGPNDPPEQQNAEESSGSNGPNGPPPAVNGAQASKLGLRRSPAPYAGKMRRGKPPISAKAHEQRLIAAMQEHSGASVNALAKAAGANRSSTGERLRGLAARGVVTKDSAGHWRLVAELAGEEPGPTQPPSS